jgi:hypothetical protein
MMLQRIRELMARNSRYREFEVGEEVNQMNSVPSEQPKQRTPNVSGLLRRIGCLECQHAVSTPDGETDCNHPNGIRLFWGQSHCANRQVPEAPAGK